MAYKTPNSMAAVNSVAISGTATSNTAILASSDGNFLPMLVTFSLLTVTGLTTPPTVSLGTTSGGTNIMAPVLLTTLNALNKTLCTVLTNSTIVTAGSPIYCNVSVIGLATTYSFTCTILGAYF